jgi:hypothetical protein
MSGFLIYKSWSRKYTNRFYPSYRAFINVKSEYFGIPITDETIKVIMKLQHYYQFQSTWISMSGMAQLKCLQ